jgi:hypothetical protein
MFPNVSKCKIFPKKEQNFKPVNGLKFYRSKNFRIFKISISETKIVCVLKFYKIFIKI